MWQEAAKQLAFQAAWLSRPHSGFAATPGRRILSRLTMAGGVHLQTLTSTSASMATEDELCGAIEHEYVLLQQDHLDEAIQHVRTLTLRSLLEKWDTLAYTDASCAVVTEARDFCTQTLTEQGARSVRLGERRIIEIAKLAAEVGLSIAVFVTLVRLVPLVHFRLAARIGVGAVTLV